MAIKIKLDPSEVRKRGYKLLLYADNRRHMQVLARIRRQEDFKRSYVGCWHIQYDSSGSEIVTGKDKKHCHVILSFDNPRYWSGVCRSLGLISDSGEPDTQFCRPIGLERDTIEGGMIYLIHANAPDKEQYSVSDLFGAPVMVEAAERAIVGYQLRHISLSESLTAINDWVNSQFGKIITWNHYVQWLVTTPYVRTGASNSLVRELIKAHNHKIATAENREKMSEFAASYEKLQSLYDLSDFYGVEDLAE